MGNGNDQTKSVPRDAAATPSRPRCALRLAVAGGLFTILGLPTLASAQQVNNSSSVYRSAYFLGRGDTGIATADNQDAIFYNPAGIAQGTGIYKKTILASPEVAASKSTGNVVREATSGSSNAINTVEDNLGKPDHVEVSNFSGLILRRAAIGVISTAHADVLAYDDPKSGGLEAVHASADDTLGATFTLADKVFSDHLMVGVTGKYLQRGRGDITGSAADADQIQSELQDKSKFLATGTGAGADIGMMYQGGGRLNPSFGLVVNDVGNTKITPTQPTTLDLGLKQTINVGTSIEVGTSYSKIKLLADYHDVAGTTIHDNYLKTHFGVELGVADHVGITGGLNEGYPTGGIYIDLYIVRLDMGMYTEEVGTFAGNVPDTRYFMRLVAGF